MARAVTLKVYRTPIGFHDAYVAAPSKKAAMEAWGSDKDLFRRGEAEEVTDPALMAEALASPGVVVKRLRGSAAEQIAALGADEPDPRTEKTRPRADKPKKAVPPPSRASLDAAEAALADAERREAAELKTLAEREAELARERRALEKTHGAERTRLQKQKDKAEAAYRQAVRNWRG